MRKQYYIWFMNIYRSSKSIKTHGKYQIQNSGHCLGGRGIGGERFTCIHNTLFLHVEVDTWVLTLLFSVFFLKFTTRKRVPRKRVPNLSYYKAFADSEREHQNLVGRRKIVPTSRTWSFRNQQGFPTHTPSIANNPRNYSKIPCRGLMTSPKF